MHAIEKTRWIEPIHRSCNGNNIIFCTTCCVQQAIDFADGRKFRSFAIIGVPEIVRATFKAFACVLLSNIVLVQ